MLEIEFFPRSNRESWRQPFALVDDATEQPISLGNYSGSGSFTSWSVVTYTALNGVVLNTTTSGTTLTVGSGTQTINVGGGLGIVAGEFVRATAANDSNAWMQGSVVSYDSAGGNLVFTVANVTITLELRRELSPRGFANPGSYYDFTGCEESPTLTATSADKISFPDLNVFEWFFTVTDMRTLLPGHYRIGCTLLSADATETVQLFVGRLPILFGGVT